MARSENVQVLIQGALAPEMPLPQMQPLTLTRNFFFVFFVCVLSLAIVPLAVGYAASILLG